MDTFTKIPGLQHIPEDIFNLLDKKSLTDCRLVNSSWKNVLDQPKFWLEKLNLENLPLDILQNWKNLAQELDDDHLEKEFVLILIKIFKGGKQILPLEIVVDLEKSNKYPELMKFLLEQADPNGKVDVVYVEKRWLEKLTPIHLAVLYGFTPLVKKLAKKYTNPIIEENFEWNPIHVAAYKGHLDIVEYLVNFTDTPNAPKSNGETLIHLASMNGHLDIVKYLISFTDNPLTQDNLGYTPIHAAARNGSLEIMKFLVDFTDNPNIRNNNGLTPIALARIYGHDLVKQFLQQYCTDKLK